MDSVDIYDGLSGQSEQCLLILWTKSSESMHKIQGVQGDWKMSMDNVHGVYGLSGHCPWTEWTFTMDSVDSLDNVHGYSGQSPVNPWTKSRESRRTGKCAWTMSTESMY